MCKQMIINNTIVIKDLEISQISTLNNPGGFDMARKQSKQIFKKCNLNIENIVMIVIKHLQMNQILALNNPLRVKMPLNK